MSTTAASVPVENAATEYVILGSDDATVYTVVGSASGSSAKSAIRGYLAGKGDVDATFVAIPARSWKPEPVKSQTTLKFGGES